MEAENLQTRINRQSTDDDEVGIENVDDVTSDSSESDSNNGSEIDVLNPDHGDDGLTDHQRRLNLRDLDVKISDTTTLLTTSNGSRLYLVGTAHFSEESVTEVRQLIAKVQPDLVMVELCSGRTHILLMDEETLLQEAKNVTFRKLKMSVQQHGVVAGVIQILLLVMAAHVTKQLGMAPGGEFRSAFQAAKKVPGCKINLGDRPIGITMKRIIAKLGWWQKSKLAWHVLTSREDITSADVEKFKDRDILESLLKELTADMPMLGQVLVAERDVYMTHRLHQCVTMSGCHPSVVVGVVGIGHTAGIVNHWGARETLDWQGVCVVPETSTRRQRLFAVTVRGIKIAVTIYTVYRLVSWLHRYLPATIKLPSSGFDKMNPFSWF